MYAGFVMFGYMQIYLDINGSTIMTVLPGGGLVHGPLFLYLFCSLGTKLYMSLIKP